MVQKLESSKAGRFKDLKSSILKISKLERLKGSKAPFAKSSAGSKSSEGSKARKVQKARRVQKARKFQKCLKSFILF
jgi:hypothetical protein